MTPFRTTYTKWDEDDGNGKYKNVDGYKYSIITKSMVDSLEDMPKCFLADTQKEAEDIYKRFEKHLNSLAYSYSMSTGIDRAELFREALIGLARGYRDWDVNRSTDFKMYATFRIKEALDEFVRQNMSSISTPAYVKKAHSNLKRLRIISDHYDVDWKELATGKLSTEQLLVSDQVKIEKCVENLKNAALRARVEYSRFIDRIELLPEIVEYSELTHYDVVIDRNQELMDAALIVAKLKDYMDKDELIVCDGIMKDKSIETIGKEIGKSKAWVSDKLKVLREKLFSVLGERV